MNEFALVQKYFKKLTYNNPSALNLNDDVFFDKKHNVVVSVDTYEEGVHFLNFGNPDLVIKKIIWRGYYKVKKINFLNHVIRLFKTNNKKK